MASKKKTKAPTVALAATLPDGTVLELAPATEKHWDRYLEKIRKNQGKVGARELVQTLCLSHPPDPNTGRVAILDRYPAAIKKIADAIDESAGGGLEVETDPDDATVEAGGCVFEGPDIDSWELLQTNIADPKLDIGVTMRSFLLEQSEDHGKAQALFLDKPACIGPIVAAIGRVAGADIKIEVKKG